MLKTHNVVVATLSVKNMALGAPLHSPRAEKRGWSDKRIYHGGVRQTHVDIALTAQKLQPFWGVAVIDGFDYSPILANPTLSHIAKLFDLPLQGDPHERSRIIHNIQLGAASSQRVSAADGM